MELKILHTGDMHIGMRFGNYPDNIRDKLREARFNTVKNLITTANDESCNIFAVAGDLFNDIKKIPTGEVEKVCDLLDSFHGECVLILPGNHDYDNGTVDLWRTFQAHLSDKIVLLNEQRVYILKETHDLDVAVYPAFCHSMHSKENSLGWMKETEEFPEATEWHIGMAHGALENISPDIKNEYYRMSEEELRSLPFDLWLLGHTHVPYPRKENVTDSTVFNAGTPEPDGMDCKHEGSAWLIKLKKENGKKIHAQQIKTGNYRFIDEELKIENIDSFEEIKKLYQAEKAKNTLLRVTLKGRIEPAVIKQKQPIYNELAAELAYFKVEDSELLPKITADKISADFTKGSFPYRLLHNLLSRDDEEALHQAYDLIELIKEAK